MTSALHQVKSDLDNALASSLKQHANRMDTQFDELKSLMLKVNKRDRPEPDDDDMQG